MGNYLEKQGLQNLLNDIAESAPMPLGKIDLQEFLRRHHRYPVIAVTGQSGAGKSTFTKILAKRLREVLSRCQKQEGLSVPGVKVYTELPQLSPYLPIIKATRAALQGQEIWVRNQELFLHLDSAIVTQAALEAKNSVVVLDFAITQVLVYGDMTIKGSEGRQFKQRFKRAFGSLPKPDLLVQIGASPQTVLNRLQKRGTYIDDELENLTETLYGYYQSSGLMEEYYSDVHRHTVHTDKLDLPENEEDAKLATDPVLRDTMDQLTSLIR